MADPNSQTMLIAALLETVTNLKKENAALQSERDDLKRTQGGFAQVYRLPAELLTRIFSYLSEWRPDVANCRLVSHTFKELSSPFLITKVVLAKRMPEIHRMYDVIDHEYFRQHVTELVYDASYHCDDLARNWNAYKQASHVAERSFDGLALKREQKSYDRLWRRMRKRPLSSPGRVPEPGPWGDFLDFYDEEDNFDQEDDSHLRSALWDSARKGFHEYSRRWLAEETLQDDDVLQFALAQAVDNFPRLSHVAFTDFRALARREKYSTLCKRKFGDAVEPYVLSDWDREGGWHDMWDVLSVLSHNENACIRSFSIQKHMFGYPAGSLVRVGGCNSHQLAAAMPLNQIIKDHYAALESNYSTAFKGMRDLRLPIRVQQNRIPGGQETETLRTNIADSILPSLLQSAARSLTQLTLTAEDLVYFVQNKLRYVVFEGGEEALDTFLFPLTLPALACLDIRGWHFNTESCRDFLARHTRNLKQLRIVDNLITGDVTALAKWAGENLHLHGAVVCNHGDYEKHPDAEKQMKEHGRVKTAPVDPESYHASLECLWLNGRNNCLEKLDGLKRWRKIERWYTG